jgi:hypothetical protein
MPLRNRLLPLLVAPVLVAVAVVAFVAINKTVNDGHLIFPLDDPYIHLAMARNISTTGTWGINPGEFASTSSAPLYTLTLAGMMALFGPSELYAWLLAISGGLFASYLFGRRAQAVGFGSGAVIIAGIYFVAVIGLVELSISGMEHTWHMCAVMAVAGAAERILGRPAGSWRQGWILILLVLIAAGLRYETLFLLPPLCLMLWSARWRTLAVIVGIVGLIPAVALGILQISQGGSFLPNTIIVKAFDTATPGLFGYVYRFLQQISSSRWIVLIAAAGAALWIGGRQSQKWLQPRMVGPALAGFVILAHCAFAIDYPRYVGYLVALGSWALLPWVREWIAFLREHATSWPHRAVAAGLVVVCLVLPFGDQIRNWTLLPLLGQDIYRQQYQMARFASTYYPGRAVAFNDIGLVAWTGKNRVLDLWGLANDRVAHWRNDREYDSKHIGEVTAEYMAPVVMIYPSWFVRYGGVPSDWYRVGNWQLPPGIRVNAGAPVVFLYATSEAEARTLLKNLKEFEPSLPQGVQAGY